MKFRWTLASPQPLLAGQLASQLKISLLLAQCLLNRGFSEVTAIENFLSPRLKNLADPFLLPNMDKAVERLKAEFQPEEIYLFGSHAWGTPTDDSDVDLMVIVRESSEKAIRRMQRAHRCLTGLGFSKDVLVPTRAQVDRYKHLHASLFHQVLAKGRKLYG